MNEREGGTTTPPASLEALRKAACWGKKNIMVGAGLSGSSFRLVYLAFCLDDEVAFQNE